MNYDKGQITYRLMFVPDHGNDFSAHLICEAEGADLAAQAGVAYMESQWVGEREPDLYGPIWDDSVALLRDFATNDQHGVVVRVEYGSLVVC